MEKASASHLVELILDLTTNIQDQAVVEVNYILGTQRGMSCILQIPTESPCQNKQTKYNSNLAWNTDKWFSYYSSHQPKSFAFQAKVIRFLNLST